VDLKIQDGHLAIEKGDLVLVDGIDAIRQHLHTRLNIFKGSWFLDQRVGMPYIEKVLVKNPNLAIISDVYRRAILTTPGVMGIDALSINLDRGTRRLSVAFNAKTTSGRLDYSEEVEI
jgi:hypothetical protein